MVLLKSLIKEAIISTIYYFAHTLEGIQVGWSSNLLISILNLNQLVLLYWVLQKSDFNSSDSIAGCRGVCVFSDPVLAACLDYSWNLQPDVVPDSSLWEVCFHLWIWVDFIPHNCIQVIVSSACHVIHRYIIEEELWCPIYKVLSVQSAFDDHFVWNGIIVSA